MTEYLKNKLILITGATSGIGREITLSLLNFQTRLLLIGRNEGILKRISNTKEKKAEVKYEIVDLSNDHDLSMLEKTIKESDIEPDVIIFCAGVFHYTDISHSSNDIIDQEYKVNFRAPFILTRSLLKNIKKKKSQIIFMNTLASIHPKSNLSAYASSKGALKTFAEVLNCELHSHGVRITTIYPSRVATPMQERACKLEGIKYIPERFINTKTIANTVLDVITSPSNAEFSEIMIKTNP